MAVQVQNMLTTKEVAALLGTSACWVYETRKRPGCGPPWYKIGGKVLYAEPEVREWMAEQRRI